MRVLASPDVPLVVADFDPAGDILVIALPEDAGGALDHRLEFRKLAGRDTLELALTHVASGARFLVHLPGLRRLPADAVAVMSMDEAALLTGRHAAPPRATRPQQLTAKRIHARARIRQGGTGAPAGPSRAMHFVHDHDWHADGPPPEQFFDLSHPGSELDVRLAEDSAGPIYAIRLTEHSPLSRTGSETHSSIILAQTAPGTPPLSNAVLTQWVATRLGSARFRAIAWIWLGNEGTYTDPATGAETRFGRINARPTLSIRGPLAGSVWLKR